MSTNVSSLRVRITGEASGLETTLTRGQKRISAFAESAARSQKMLSAAVSGLGGGETLGRQLSQVQAEIDRVSTAYVQGGKVTRAELDALIAKERQLQGAIESRKALLNSLRGTGGDLPEVAALRGAAAYRPAVARTEEQQLTRVRKLLQEVAADEVRSGQSRTVQIQRLIRLEANLTEAISRRGEVIGRVQAAMHVGPMAGPALPEVGPSVASQRTPRSVDAQLSAVRQRMQQVAAEYVRTGQTGGHQLDRLTRLEARLTSAIADRDRVMARSRVTAEVAARSNSAFAASSSRAAAASREMAGGSSRASMAITQLGFAAEDAAIVYGTMGLSGALRAAGNNLSFVAAMFNPLLGITVGIGTALAAIFIPKMLGAADAVEKLTEAMFTLRRAKFDASLAGIANTIGRVPGAFDDMRPPTQFQAAREGFEGNLSDERSTQDRLRRELRGWAAEFAPGLRESQLDALFSTWMRDRDPDAFRSLMLRDERTGTLSTAVSAIPEDKLQAAMDAIRGIGEEAIQSGERIKALQSSLSTLAKNEAERSRFNEIADRGAARTREIERLERQQSEQRSFATDFLSSFTDADRRVAAANATLDRRLAEIERLFPGDANSRNRQIFGDAARAVAERDRQGPRKESQGLAGGFQFGSREAVSALNRAAFAASKTEDKIEKNTREAAGVLKEIDRKLGRQDRGEPVVAGETL